MENWSKRLAKSIMERTPRLYEEKWYKGKWSYDYGVVLKGFQLLWEQTQEKIYFDFIKNNIDYFVQEDGTIRGYSVEEYNIDHVNTGKLFFLLYKETGEEKTILFGLTGTGYFDMLAYEKFNDGLMSDYIPTDEELQKGFDGLPNVPEN